MKGIKLSVYKLNAQARVMIKKLRVQGMHENPFHPRSDSDGSASVGLGWGCWSHGIRTGPACKAGPGDGDAPLARGLPP
jgi:hypothetical protein